MARPNSPKSSIWIAGGAAVAAAALATGGKPGAVNTVRRCRVMAGRLAARPELAGFWQMLSSAVLS